MRKILLMAFCLVALIGAMCSFSSCKNHRLQWSEKGVTPAVEKAIDSLVQLGIKDAVNPIFLNVEEVLVYRDIVANTQEVDSVFNTLSPEIISKVATVLINREGSTTKKSIVMEYRQHIDIYNNLSPTPVAQPTQPSNKEPIASVSVVKEEKTTVTEAPPTRVEINSKDTTIDGKKARITKTIEKYE